MEVWRLRGLETCRLSGLDWIRVSAIILWVLVGMEACKGVVTHSTLREVGEFHQMPE